MLNELSNPSEFARWEKRFSVPDYVFGTEPNAFLKAQTALLPTSGTALAVADGEGRNGVWLAEQGLDVLAIDFSPTALDKARALAAEPGHSSFSPSELSGASTVARWPCRSCVSAAT